MTPAVRYVRTGAIGEIVLDRPDNRNSMMPELLDAFARASEAARRDDARCILIRGEGRCFSAGADFSPGGFPQSPELQRDVRALPHERSFAMYEPFLSVWDLAVPVIAALNGHAVGGGFGLALMCDIRIANRSAKYGANFCRLGLSSGMAISYLLPRIVGASKAAELLYTGRLMLGDELEAIGLCSQAVDADAVVDHARELAQSIADSAPLAVRAVKQTLREGMGWDPRRAAMREAALQAQTIDTEDAREGIAALLEKRKPVFRGC